MHNKRQMDDRVVEILARRQEAGTRAIRTGEPFRGALEAEEKSTSAEGRASSKGEYKRTQEWWEGYDPGMDVGF
jgi:hypothetical protein